MIEIKVDGQIVSVQVTQPLYSGTADVQICRFSFDKSWSGFSKTAVFRVGAEAHTKLLDENDCCILPWELLTHRNVGWQLEVGMYGVSADTEIMTSVWDSLGMIREGSAPGSDARNPTDGIYEQIMAKLQRIYEAMGIYDDGMLALVQRAETAARMAGESAEAAAQTMEDVKELLEKGAAAPDVPYCIEYGTLEYSSDSTQELLFNFSQSYRVMPVFIPYAQNAALTLSIKALHSQSGYYGGRVTVSNTSGLHITAPIAVSAYCAHPTGKESETL